MSVDGSLRSKKRISVHYNAHKFDIVKGRLKVKFTHRFFRPLCNVEISSFDAASENW